MSILFGAVAVTVIYAYVTQQLRLARIRRVEHAERLRLRFGRLRHRLVMHGGSGKMGADERDAFRFLYEATTVVLHNPKSYRSFSHAVCINLLDPELSARPPRLKKKSISKATRPLFKEFVKASDDLVNQFTDPMLVILVCFGQGHRNVIEACRAIAKTRRELEERKAAAETWRQAGANAVGMRRSLAA